MTPKLPGFVTKRFKPRNIPISLLPKYYKSVVISHEETKDKFFYTMEITQGEFDGQRLYLEFEKEEDD